MASLPQVPPVQPVPVAQPTQIDAFRAALNTAGAALSANPDAIGQTLLSGIDGFNARESQFQSVVTQAITGDATKTNSATDGGYPSSAGATDAAPPGLTAAQALHEGEALQRQSMGVMMQTYSFALEATLVSNAATTFTGSVNTLIKTQ
jgi:hypothetical protein